MTLEPQDLLENLNKMRVRKDESFQEALESLEIKTEKEIQDCLAPLGMEDLKRTHRKSLPYKEELLYLECPQDYFGKVEEGLAYVW
jgi:hypothetical protein